MKLAAAMAAEAAGDDATAARLYDLVSTTDPTFVSATFGLARCLKRAAKRPETVAVYQRVPANSSLYLHAQMGMARVLIDLHGGASNVDELSRASAAIDALTAEGREIAELRAELFESALRMLFWKSHPTAGNGKTARLFPGGDVAAVRAGGFAPRPGPPGTGPGKANRPGRSCQPCEAGYMDLTQAVNASTGPVPVGNDWPLERPLAGFAVPQGRAAPQTRRKEGY